jgi:transcriptional regulator with XRE-family HTH domain
MGKDELRDALGKNLKLYRFLRKFSQADLAKKANISITFLSDIERGNKWPYSNTLANLAKALDVPVPLLFRQEKDASEESRFAMYQFSRDIRKSVDDTLETIFREYLG